ncbi:MAG: hypothetical protein AAGD22_06890 [Verrucomicrobiota bacterium]
MNQTSLLPIIFLAAALSSCTTPLSHNPSFNITRSDGRETIAQLQETPEPLERPLIIIGGFFDPGVGAKTLKNKFSKITTDTPIVAIPLVGCKNFDACVTRVLREIKTQLPNGNSDETLEVDVVGISMGGLVARYAAVPHSYRTRLHIHRLFTISSPHQGAKLAPLPAFNELQIEMRPGSVVLQAIEESTPDYEIYPYVRLGDEIVGADNAAPAGENPWWVPAHIGEPRHHFAFVDSRFLAEIGLKLRGYEGYATHPRTPLP